MNKNKNLPKFVLRAFVHLNELGYDARMVVFTKEAHWLFMDESGESLRFRGNVDISLLENAVDTLDTLPAFYHYEPDLINGPQDIEPGHFYINKKFPDSLYIATNQQQMVVIKSKEGSDGNVCFYDSNDSHSKEFWNSFHKTNNPFEK
jgi:hypothetical protein